MDLEMVLIYFGVQRKIKELIWPSLDEGTDIVLIILCHTEGIQNHAEQGCQTPTKNKQKSWVRWVTTKHRPFYQEREGRLLHGQLVSAPPPSVSAWPPVLSRSPLYGREADDRQTAALYCPPSSSSWRHCYFSLLLDSSPLAFYTVSLLPKLLRQSFSGQLAVPSIPYSTQHMVQMVQLYNRWAGALRHILLDGLGDSLIHMILKFM